MFMSYNGNTKTTIQNMLGISFFHSTENPFNYFLPDRLWRHLSILSTANAWASTNNPPGSRSRAAEWMSHSVMVRRSVLFSISLASSAISSNIWCVKSFSVVLPAPDNALSWSGNAMRTSFWMYR